MKNKTLPILLLIPFVVALLAFVSVVALNNTVASDILGIVWAYDDNVGFKVDELHGYALEAEARIDESLILAPGNDLVWKVTALDGSETNDAKIENSNGNFFLYALDEGTCKVICQNERGTVSRYFTAQLFESGTIVINPRNAASGNSIEPYRTYGQYDFVYDSLSKDGYSSKPAEFTFDTAVYFEHEISQEVQLIDKSSNLDYEDGKITIRGAGDAYFTLRSAEENWINATYSFKVIEGAYNIYSYDDLLMATNLSSKGEKAVLQTNLESLKNTFVSKNGSYTDEKLSPNTNLYGHYANGNFSFDSEVYRFETTYNWLYIDQYNKANNTNFEPIVLSGIRVQKDFYGNGFKINFHELAYPTDGTVGQNGKLMPGQKDLFKGPLPYVTIGALSDSFMVKALGQDNSGLYLDGDNITVDNVHLSNTNNIDNMYNLTYTGSVVDVHGKNNTLKNSIIENGKTAVRAFSADNFLLDNCILRNAGEFLLKVGSDDMAAPDQFKRVSYSNSKVSVSESAKDYLAPAGEDLSKMGADNVYAAFVAGKFGGHYDPSTSNQYTQLIASMTPDFCMDWSDEDMKIALEAAQNALDNPMYSASPDRMRVHNTNFYNSGIFSIAFDSAFNGPYLYGGLPSVIGQVVNMLGATVPNQIGGTSRPVQLSLTGKTNFYDWKDIDTIDLSILIDENISAAAEQMAGRDIKVTIDDFFPVRALLKEEAAKAGTIYNKDGKKYINSEVAWYGGGLNDSRLITDSLASESDFSSELEADLIKGNIGNKYIANTWYLEIMAKAVVTATGTHAFRFMTNEAVGEGTPALFGQAPQLSDLIANRNS